MPWNNFSPNPPFGYAVKRAILKSKQLKKISLFNPLNVERFIVEFAVGLW